MWQVRGVPSENLEGKLMLITYHRTFYLFKTKGGRLRQIQQKVTCEIWTWVCGFLSCLCRSDKIGFLSCLYFSDFTNVL